MTTLSPQTGHTPIEDYKLDDPLPKGLFTTSDFKCDCEERLDRLEKEVKSLRGMVFLSMKKRKTNNG